MTEESALVFNGSIATTLAIFLQTAVLKMVPYSVPAIAIIILDLLYGIKAARHRGEKVRFSTALRRTMTKMFSYVCWLILASTLALAFGMPWIEWTILGIVYLNELSSVVGNYLEQKGLELDTKAVWTAIFHIGGQKVGVDTQDIDPGRFVRRIEEKEHADDTNDNDSTL